MRASADDGRSARKVLFMLPSAWNAPAARGTTKVRPRSLRPAAMSSVSQLTQAPQGAAYSPLSVPLTTATASELHAPVMSPVASSMMSPEFSTCMWTSEGSLARISVQNVCTEATAVATSRKYIVLTPGPPIKPVQADRTRYNSVMVSSDRPIQNGIELASLVPLL